MKIISTSIVGSLTQLLFVGLLLAHAATANDPYLRRITTYRQWTNLTSHIPPDLISIYASTAGG
ncbi:MAG TPA: hypothetical protein VGQ39_11050 [Pyrinomonadaceae bacterium]|nr:hypothetical protein [Pyrinomonadaceae bacterium]